MAEVSGKDLNADKSDLSLSKQDILRGYNSFKNIFDDHKILSSQNFVIYFQYRNNLQEKFNDSPSGIKTGFIVSKKKVRKAVGRNKLKRYLREIYRHNKLSQEKGSLHMIISFTDPAIEEFLKSKKLNIPDFMSEFKKLKEDLQKAL